MGFADNSWCILKYEICIDKFGANLTNKHLSKYI